jgi:hypothetical protein
MTDLAALRVSNDAAVPGMTRAAQWMLAVDFGSDR